MVSAFYKNEKEKRHALFPASWNVERYAETRLIEKGELG